MEMRFGYRLRKCPICGSKPQIKKELDYPAFLCFLTNQAEPPGNSVYVVCPHCGLKGKSFYETFNDVDIEQKAVDWWNSAFIDADELRKEDSND